MLKAKKKFTKRELKEDKFFEVTFQAKNFIEQNARTILYAAGAVLALSVMIYFYMGSQQAEEQNALDQFARAQEQVRNGQREVGMQMMIDVVEQFDGTTAAGHAAFFLGKLFWEDKDLQTAKKYFKKYIDDYSDKNLMTQSALAGYGDCLLYEKNYAEAAKYFEKAGKIDPDFPAATDYLYTAALVYQEAGNLEKARELAQKIVDESSNVDLKNRSEVLLKSLEL